MRVELDLVPLRDASLQPHEILMSESQERMMAVVEPEKLEEFLAITDRWDVEATVIGEVTEGDNLVITWHGDVIVDVPPRSVAHDGPVVPPPARAPRLPRRPGRRRARRLGPARLGRAAAQTAADHARLAEPLRPRLG